MAFDLAVLASFAVMTLGVGAQIARIIERKSSRDISITEVTARFLAVIIITLRWSIVDPVGFWGQLVVLTATGTNLAAVIIARFAEERREVSSDCK